MTTEDGSFLRRWSRRKEEARQAEADPAPPPEPEAEPEAEPGPEEAAAPFDPASLPPLESLGPDSDYTAFLRREVPRALRSAALRRAWASHPAIVAHRPLVEYDWNWNAPGYGALRPGDEAGPLIEALFGHLRAKAAPPEAAQDALEDGLGDGVGDAPEPKAPEAGAPEAAPPGRPTASGPPLPDDGEPEPPAVPLPMEAPPASPEPGAVEPDWSAPDEPAPGALAGGGGEATAPAPRRRHGGAAPV